MWAESAPGLGALPRRLGIDLRTLIGPGLLGYLSAPTDDSFELLPGASTVVLNLRDSEAPKPNRFGQPSKRPDQRL